MLVLLQYLPLLSLTHSPPPSLLVRDRNSLLRHHLLRRRAATTSAFPVLPHGLHDVIDAQEHARGLDRRLERLDLDAGRLVKAVLLHVDKLRGVAVYAPLVLAVRVLGLEGVSV